MAEACHELPHSNNPDEQPEGITQGVQKLLKFITDQGQELHQAPDTLLWRLLKHPMPRSLGKSLSDDERVKASVKEIMKAAQTVKPDMVPLIGIKRRLQTLRDVGAIKAMGLADQCKELLEAIDDKVRALRIKPDEVVSAFANKHMRTQQEKAINSRNKVCAAHNFELLADALYRAKDEDEAARIDEEREVESDPESVDLSRFESSAEKNPFSRRNRIWQRREVTKPRRHTKKDERGDWAEEAFPGSLDDFLDHERNK